MKPSFSQRSPVALGRRLLSDTSGQVLLFGAVLVVAILAFLFVIPNGTQITTKKMRAQTAADAGAFTGSVWLARATNLSSNMNIGIKSVYEWTTVLTVGSALAQALYSDTLDSSVHALGGQITLALFGSSNPVTVHTTEYPSAIRKLDTAAQWLYSLQGDIATSFHSVAATLGTQQACSNVGVAYPPTQAAGGWAIVRTNDTIPLLLPTTAGDSVIYAGLSQLALALDTLPTLDPNITPAYGQVIVSPSTWDVWAYYSDTSLWFDRVDSIYHCYKKPVIFEFQNNYSGKVDTGIQYMDPSDKGYPDYNRGDSWPKWVLYCSEGEGNHHVFIWPNGVGNPPYKNTDQWTLINNPHPGNNRYKFDTVWTHVHLAKSTDTSSLSDYVSPEESIWLEEHEDEIRSHYWKSTGFYTGVESTVPYKGPKVRPRRVNPGREFRTVCYVWRQGASSAPYGLGAPLGGTFFPRNAVAASSPMFAVARSVPYQTLSSPTQNELFFEPSWDVKLTPFDSLAVVEITGDTAYCGRTGYCFDNLEELRKYALLP
ncbi:hypothetical protein FJY68_00780 [candidate division WOR-3 bacterium]|uniref:Putative Flp pilus-assembly TadG-like N-terminal domain-containing protein n=1 Tax=candidate division WOR-3 bacterium TaxID=2052148 RepID=A0A937XB20_UNCW3|nr:hypothetical protein [candidate division WOR-3 bacterium]